MGDSIRYISLKVLPICHLYGFWTIFDSKLLLATTKLHCCVFHLIRFVSKRKFVCSAAKTIKSTFNSTIALLALFMRYYKNVQRKEPPITSVSRQVSYWLRLKNLLFHKVTAQNTTNFDGFFFTLIAYNTLSPTRFPDQLIEKSVFFLSWFL